jgi:small-conductance mechanosensitive channel
MSQQTNTPQQPQKATSPNENQSVSLNTSQILSACAVGLIICFFLPWISFLFLGKPSGFDLAKEGAKAEGKAFALVFLWAIPFCSIVTVLAGMVKQSQKNIAQFTGALPFAALAVALYFNGSDLLKVLEFGAYISLVLGLVLFILPRRLK